MVSSRAHPGMAYSPVGSKPPVRPIEVTPTRYTPPVAMPAEDAVGLGGEVVPPVQAAPTRATAAATLRIEAAPLPRPVVTNDISLPSPGARSAYCVCQAPL